MLYNNIISWLVLVKGSEWTREWWQWRGTPHSLKFQHNWNLTIRLFRVISRTLIGEVGGSYPSAEKHLVYSTAPADWAMNWVSSCICSHTILDKKKRLTLRIFIETIDDVYEKFGQFMTTDYFFRVFICIRCSDSSLATTNFFLMIISSFLIIFKENINW